MINLVCNFEIDDRFSFVCASGCVKCQYLSLDENQDEGLLALANDA